MTITVHIDDPLASMLQSTAASRQLTAAELAKQLLADALDDKNGEWDKRNQRRIELIRKSNREGLSSEESAELQQLQDAADQRLEQVDLQLLDQLDRFRDEVEKLPSKEIDFLMTDLFEYPSQPHVRKHGPQGYRSYESYKPQSR